MRLEEFLCETPVESSWITDLVYNRPNRILTMRLNNGKQYHVANVSRTFFDRWKNANSKGRFYHQFVKDIYPINRIK